MAKSNFAKMFLIALGIGGAAGIVAGLGDRAEAATKAPPPPPPKSPAKKKRRKVASADVEQEGEEAMVGASPFARPLAYLYGVWPLIKSGIATHATMQQALRVAGSLWGNESFTKNGAREELKFVSTLVHELLRRLSMETTEQGEEEAMVGASPFARPLAYLYGVWPLIKAGIASRETMQQAFNVAWALKTNPSFGEQSTGEEVRFIDVLVPELQRRLGNAAIVGGEEGESEGVSLTMGPDYRTPEEKKRDAEKYAKYKKEWLDTPKGKEWQALQQTVSLVHWYRIAVKHISDLGNKPLTLTVQKFSGTTDYYPPGAEGKALKLDRNGAFALAKKVADAFKKTRGTDVAVEWTAATD